MIETYKIDTQEAKLTDIKKDFYDVGPNKLWVNDFVQNFYSNWMTNQNEAENVYLIYKDKIRERQYDSLPPFVFSEEFISILYEMIDLQYQESFLPDALTIIYSFYVYDEEIELSPLQDIFIQIESIFHESSDETKDQILELLSSAVNHSQESHDFIMNLFPVDFLSRLFNSNPDFSDSISRLVDAYSKNENDYEQAMNILDLSIQILQNSIVYKENKPHLIINTYSITRSLYSIEKICITMSQNDGNPALEFLYENEVDILLDFILQKASNFKIRILKLVNFMYQHVKLLPNQNSFDIVDNSKTLIPRISYTNFISFLSIEENIDNQLECLTLSEEILSNQFSLSEDKDKIYSYILQKDMLANYQIMIENGAFKLKIGTISSLFEFLQHIPEELLNQIFEIKLTFSLIDELESDSALLTVCIFKCLNAIIKRANKYGFPIQEIFDYFEENVDIIFDDEDESVQEEFAVFQAFSHTFNDDP